MTQQEVIREFCRISALAYKSIGDYTYASDGFCDLCPNTEAQGRSDSYRNDGKVIEYVRQAVLEKLKRDGYEISVGFDPETGKEIPR